MTAWLISNPSAGAARARVRVPARVRVRDLGAPQGSRKERPRLLEGGMGRSRPCLPWRKTARAARSTPWGASAAAERAGNPLRVEAIGDLLGRHSHRRRPPTRAAPVHGGHGASGPAPAPALGPQSQQRHRCESTEQRERHCPSGWAGSVPLRPLVPIGFHHGRAAGCHGVPSASVTLSASRASPRRRWRQRRAPGGPDGAQDMAPEQKGRCDTPARGSSVDQKTCSNVAHADGAGRPANSTARGDPRVRAPQRSGGLAPLRAAWNPRLARARRSRRSRRPHSPVLPVPGRLRVARTGRRSPADDHEREAPAVRDRHDMARHPLL